MQEITDETEEKISKYLAIAPPADYGGMIMRLFDFDLNNIEDYSDTAAAWLRYFAENPDIGKDIHREILNPHYELLFTMLNNMVSFCNETVRSKELMAALDQANITMNIGYNDEFRQPMTNLLIKYTNRINEQTEANQWNEDYEKLKGVS